MELLKQKILQEGTIVLPDIIKVDSFLNHQMDIGLINEIGKEFKRRFSDTEVTKILTVEASGIGIACIAAQYFMTPVIFAKKTESRNVGADVYEANVHSFTKNKNYNIYVSRKYLNEADKVLIIDDFLANGEAAGGLANIIGQAGASVAGIGIVIEKGFQNGGKQLRSAGLRVESLAVIGNIKNGQIIFK